MYLRYNLYSDKDDAKEILKRAADLKDTGSTIIKINLTKLNPDLKSQTSKSQNYFNNLYISHMYLVSSKNFNFQSKTEIFADLIIRGDNQILTDYHAYDFTLFFNSTRMCEIKRQGREQSRQTGLPHETYLYIYYKLFHYVDQNYHNNFIQINLDEIHCRYCQAKVSLNNAVIKNNDYFVSYKLSSDKTVVYNSANAVLNLDRTDSNNKFILNKNIENRVAINIEKYLGEIIETSKNSLLKEFLSHRGEKWQRYVIGGDIAQWFKMKKRGK